MHKKFIATVSNAKVKDVSMSQATYFRGYIH